MLSDLVGFDYLEMYRRYSVGSGYLRLNRNIKRKFVDEMEDAARRSNMRFYVSDAHFKERCDNGSCCGLSEDWNYSRGQYCEALVLCKKNGRVTWGEIGPEMVKSGFDKFRWGSAENYNQGTSGARAKFLFHTMMDFLRWHWNNPKSAKSPYVMFEGIMKPVDKDENGDLIYEYDASRE